MKSQQKKPSYTSDVMRYAGLGAQIFISLGIAVYAGYKADGWLHTPLPLLVWILPLLILTMMIYRLIKDTTKSKKKMIKSRLKGFFPIALVFIMLNTFFIFGKSMLQRWNADEEVMIIGNAILFIITLFSFLLAKRGLSNPNPHAFVRSVYSSILLKLFVCMIAALTYIAIYQKDLNKPALFTCMGLYLLYTFLEVSILTRLLRHKER